MKLSILIEYENGICETVDTDAFESFSDFVNRAVGKYWIIFADQAEAYNARYVRSICQVERVSGGVAAND